MKIGRIIKDGTNPRRT